MTWHEQDKREDVRVLRRSHSDGIIGPPSAPPMLDGMVLDPAEQCPATPTYSAHTAFSYDAAALQQNTPSKRFETSMRWCFTWLPPTMFMTSSSCHFYGLDVSAIIDDTVLYILSTHLSFHWLLVLKSCLWEATEFSYLECIFVEAFVGPSQLW